MRPGRAGHVPLSCSFNFLPVALPEAGLSTLAGPLLTHLYSCLRKLVLDLISTGTSPFHVGKGLAVLFFSRPSVNNLLLGQLWSNNIESEIRWPQCRQTKQAPRGRQRSTGQMKGCRLSHSRVGAEPTPLQAHLQGPCEERLQKYLRGAQSHDQKGTSRLESHVMLFFKTEIFRKKLVGSESKESACPAGDPGSIPGLGRSPGGGNSSPFQYSGPENPMDRGAWLHGVAKNWTRLSTHSLVSDKGFILRAVLAPQHN